MDFRLSRAWAPLTPASLKEQLYLKLRVLFSQIWNFVTNRSEIQPPWAFPEPHCFSKMLCKTISTPAFLSLLHSCWTHFLQPQNPLFQWELIFSSSQTTTPINLSAGIYLFFLLILWFLLTIELFKGMQCLYRTGQNFSYGYFKNWIC